MDGLATILAAVRQHSADVKAYRDLGAIVARMHPNGELLIFNYTAAATYRREWTPVERVSRGLIIHWPTASVVALPFPKFFNLNEQPETRVEALPPGPIEVTAKLDGCFLPSTPLNLWGGGTITIGEVVRKKLKPTLIGMDEQGNVVPCEIREHFSNGTKDQWLAITLSNPVSRKSGAANHPNVLRVTPNHAIYLNGHFQPACMAKAGDAVTTAVTRPSDSALHMIEASLLGDGSLTCIHTGYQYQEPHKESHSEYVMALRYWLGECATAACSTTSGYGTTMMWAQSKQYDILAPLRAKWYPDGKKKIPDDLAWLDDFAVAKWYMDDGSLAHNEVQQDRALFATNCFEENDVVRLGAHLTQLYGVSCTAYDSKGWNLRLNAGKDGEIERFWQAISPHIVPCMRYKLPERYRTVPYQPYPQGGEEMVAVPACVLEVKEIPVVPGDRQANVVHFGNGRTGLDVKTTTGNYFAKGILVHNSLGISYWEGTRFAVATRGSFIGLQAEWATARLHAAHPVADLPRDITLLFEVIYPQNRVVINYGATEGLFLIGARSLGDGRDLGHAELATLAERYGFPLVPIAAVPDLAALVPLALSATGIEGWVVRYPNGLRVKIKTAEYLRFHRLVTGLTPARVREILADDPAKFDAFITDLPDEFQDEARAMAGTMLAAVDAQEAQLRALFTGPLAAAAADSRKTFAQLVMRDHKPDAKYLFALLDARPIRSLLLADLDIDALPQPTSATSGFWARQQRAIEGL